MFHSLFPFLHPTFPFAHYRFSHSLSNSLLLHSPTLRSSPDPLLSSTPPFPSSNAFSHSLLALLFLYNPSYVLFSPSNMFLPYLFLLAFTPALFLVTPSLPFPSYPCLCPHDLTPPRCSPISLIPKPAHNSLSFCLAVGLVHGLCQQYRLFDFDDSNVYAEFRRVFPYLAFAWWTQRSPSTTR